MANKKTDMELKIDEILASAKKVKPVETPAFFTEKALNKLRAAEQQQAISFGGLLKIAAVILLLVINVFTVKYILTPSATPMNNSTTTVASLLNEYQPNDTLAITFNQTIGQ